MRISDRLQKQYWRRRINPDSVDKHTPVNAGYYQQSAMSLDDGCYMLLTQEDFCRENDPMAHDINSKYMSLRPIYEVRKKLDADGKDVLDEEGKPINEWHIVDFEPVETVRFGLQRRINTSKAAFMAGNGFGCATKIKTMTLARNSTHGKTVPDSTLHGKNW